MPNERKRYFHWNTVANFIRYFDEIMRQGEKDWIYRSLTAYFDAAKEHIDNIETHSSHELYKVYLYKVAAYYDENLKFSYFMDLWIVIAIYSGLGLVGLLFLKPLIVCFVALFLFGLNWTYLWIKRKQGRTFGIYH